ncbi:MAG TPA: hypothetical protein VKA34_01415 [Balneolales bacterium]|nr:hypothetical protein [Balneolales bacterium]
MQNRSFTQYLHFQDFEILESRKHFGMLRFRSRSSFNLEQNPWFCIAFQECSLCYVICHIGRKVCSTKSS